MIVLELPILVRLIALALVGAGVGSVVNWAIYSLAWNRRAIGPWTRRAEGVPDRRSSDRVPVLGWWGLRREAPVHGRGFWVRPALIEVAWIVGLPWMYWRYVEQASAFSERVLPLGQSEIVWANTLFAVHAALLAALCIATFIDFDEQTIPDEVTVCGTLLALAISPFVYVHPPIVVAAGVAGYEAAPLLASSPASWPESFDGAWGLAYGLLTYGGWCVALMSWVDPRVFFRVVMRRPATAMKFLLAAPLRQRDRRLTAIFAGLLAIGVVAILGVHALGGTAWQGLLTALLGLAFGAGLIWAIRVVASAALGQEAMGFGDVTLMAMIGACLGWQPSLATFFLAPFAAVVIAVAQYVATRRNDIAFGPYLSLGAAVVALWWEPIWSNWARELFRMGIFIPQAIGACVILMGAMLFVWRLFKRHTLGIDDSPRGRRQDDEDD